MPQAKICLDCGRITSHAPKGRCPTCQAERDRNDPYQSPQWRAAAKRAKRHGECAICGSRKRLIAHHRQARKEGGEDDDANLLSLCGEDAIGMPWKSCHSQYEADKRAGKDTELRRLVEAL